MKKLHPLLLSLLSGILLFLAWPVSPMTFLIFIAWVPLLWLFRQDPQRKARKFFGYTYLTLLTWNACTTWWIWNASEPGALGAIILNSLIMCLPWMGYRFVYRRLGENLALIALPAFWLTFEYLHLHDWGLSWPWLTLGNAFASRTSWIQWYEFTGTSGGSLWILAVNILIYKILVARTQQLPIRRKLITLGLTIVLPLALSLILPLMSPPVGDKRAKDNIVIVQPNIDPYQKMATGSFEAMLQKLIRISEQKMDTDTRLVIWPETAIYNETGIDESNLKANLFLAPLWDFMRRHPNITLLTGIEGFRFFKEKHSATATRIQNSDTWVESYNSALLIDSSGPIVTYHKSKFVPGPEALPFWLHILDSWFEKFGGTTSGYTGQDERTVLYSRDSSYRIAPAVCYESIYGEFMSEFVRNGADIIAVITNDGWWGDTPGYRQHLSYARLLSIENRRWTVRSANTGISAVIDPYGNIVEASPWSQMTALRTSPPLLTDLTFFSRFGDIISKLAAIAAIALTGWLIRAIIRKKHTHA